MSRLYIKGIGMMVGMIFGAGIFALPYVFSKAGLFWGIFNFIITFLILIFLNLLYGEVAYYTKGKHRFTGYTEIFLGKRAKLLAFITSIAAYYGSLLIYGLMGGIFLSNIFSNFSAYNFSILFFAVTGIFVLLNLGKIAEINFYLSIPLFGFIVYLFFVSIPSIDIDNFFSKSKMIFNGSWFLPYGVWIFALCGFAAVPEVRDIFSKSPIRWFKKVIIVSLILSAIFYFLFIGAVWGVSGSYTTNDALSGIANFLGTKAFIIGSLIGFLAVFTSFLALAIDMKNIFFYDYKIPPITSWFFTVMPPMVIFFLGLEDFVRILGIVGTLGLGTLGVFIILMAKKLRERIKSGDPGDILKDDNGEYMKPRRFSQALVLIGIFIGVILELWNIFK